MNNDKTFIRNVSVLSFVGILVRIIGLFYRIPLTNIIGNEGNGYYGSAYNIYTMILLISSTSIPMAVSKLLSSNQWKKEEKSEVFRCMIIYAFISGFIGSEICYSFAHILTIGNTKAIPVLKMLAPTIFFSSLMGTFRGYFQSKKNMVPTAISQLIEQLINAIVSISMAYFLIRSVGQNKAIWGAVGGATGTLAGAIAGFIFLLILYFSLKKKEKKEKRIKGNKKEIYKVLILTMIPMILSTFVHNIGSTIDMTLFYNILQWKGMDYQNLSNLYGVYSGQFLVLYHIPTALVATISISIMPLISSAKTKKEIKENSYKAMQTTCMIIFPCVAGLILLAEPILQVLFHQSGEYFILSVKFLQFGIIGTIGTSFTTVMITILQGLNHMKTPIKNITISIIIQTILNTFLFLFTDLNIYVLIVSTITYSILTCYLNMKSLSKDIPIFKVWIKSIKIPLIATTIMIIVLIFLIYLQTICQLSIYLFLVISICLSIFIYFGFYFLLYKKQKIDK